MRKLHLILLSLVAAVPGGYLCYLLGTALTVPRHDLWNKPLLGIAVVSTGLMVLLLAVVWPLLYAVAFYDDPNKGKKSADDAAGAEDESLDADAESSAPKTPRSEGFEDEDIDVFDREGVKPDAEVSEDIEEAYEGEEFGMDDESIESAETADFDLGDDEFADLNMDDEDEEEEEAPKKKSKAKAKDTKAKKKKK